MIMAIVMMTLLAMMIMMPKQQAKGHNTEKK